jgi:hypothetical protein
MKKSEEYPRLSFKKTFLKKRKIFLDKHIFII